METESFTLRHTVRVIESKLALAAKEQQRALAAVARFAAEIAEDPQLGRFATEGNLTSAAADAARWTTEIRALATVLEDLIGK